jgi:hypothetical protein
MARSIYYSGRTWSVERAKGLVLCILAMVALLGLFIMAEPANAATTFTVNSTGDENDLDFPDGAFDGSSANTCDVTSTTFGNQCTLRAAIQQANVTTCADTIAFSISGNGPHTISPTSVLPTITGEVTIDGYTQGDSTTGTAADDAVENTIPLTESGSNAVLKIELNGTNAGTGSDKDGLTIACCPNGGPGRVVVLRLLHQQGHA